ncbi:hypothetical protein AAEX28_12460 [Lentisphaerota bacterium WC36G]|nr:hypothetical protein LJT99_15285 [Lentisphaerae bacterium WC36]
MIKQYNEDKYYSMPTTPAHEVDETTECMQLVIDTIKKRQARNFLQQGVMQRILIDLEEIRKKSKEAYESIFYALTLYPASYSDIGRKRNVSKVAIFKTLKFYAKKYDWIADIVKTMRND